MTPLGWKIIGFAGQAIFASRFLVQWLTSEARRESVIPDYFWYASLAGATLLFSYAVYIRDPVFILGQSFGGVVYIRNLYLIRRKARCADEA